MGCSSSTSLQVPPPAAEIIAGVRSGREGAARDFREGERQSVVSKVSSLVSKSEETAEGRGAATDPQRQQALEDSSRAAAGDDRRVAQQVQLQDRPATPLTAVAKAGSTAPVATASGDLGSVVPRPAYDAVMATRLQSRGADGEPPGGLHRKSRTSAEGAAEVPGLAGGAKSSSPSREEAIVQGKRLLAKRLESFRMATVEMEDDGNCQFRALSYELFGTQRFHREVRRAAVRHMKGCPSDFRVFFEAEKDWDDYIGGMELPGTWGDELTLRAVADAACVKIHVVTSDTENWYLQYTPAGTPVRELFLNYISPIHYNTMKPVAVR